MHTNDVKLIAKDITKGLKDYFGNRVNDFCIFDLVNEPYKAFSINFKAYNYFVILLNYEKGRIGCSIQYGEKSFIPIENSQKWYEEMDFNIFCRELKEQLELRIPDKFLKFYGWK